MAKVEIEVPAGKVADVTKDDDKVVVTFKEANVLDRLKSVQDVLVHIVNLRDKGIEWAEKLLQEYCSAVPGSYSEKVTFYRMVIAALTNNEKRHLKTGDCWCPIIQFCDSKSVMDDYEDRIIGTIKSEGETFTVIGSCIHYHTGSGLGAYLNSADISSPWTTVSFRSVSQRDVALHISKYFGRLLFEVHYGGTNCDWAWTEI